MIARTLPLLLAALPASLFSQPTDYCLMVEAYAVDGIPGMTTYRFYVNALNATDFVGAVYGDAVSPLAIHTSTGFYNDDLGGTTADAINPAIFAAVPSAEFDSWITIGSSSTPMPPAMAITAIESPVQPWLNHFAAGSASSGMDVVMDDAIGGIWFLMAGAANGLPGLANMRVLVMQLTVPSGDDLWGTLNFQVFVEGDPLAMVTRTCSFNGAGTFCPGDQVAVAEAEGEAWSVYPTVTQGPVSVTGWAASAGLEVFNAAGQWVQSLPASPRTALDLSGLPGGWYTVVATDSRRRSSRRVFIAN
jgi:hypothetical protein